MTIINLTPHSVDYIDETGSVETFLSQGVARASQSIEEVGTLSGHRLVRYRYGAPVGLPDYKEGTFYIVSSILVDSVLQVGRRPDDLLLPADTVRDGQGRIAGCKAFSLV